MAEEKKLILSDLQSQPGKGLECLGCGCHHFYTAWTRQHKNKTVRSKVCRHCGRKHTTIEKVVR